jgi:hypothetical protein
MKACLVAIAAISCMGTSSAFTRSRNTASAPPSLVLSIRGGANEYEAKFEGIKASIIDKASSKVSFSFGLCSLKLLSVFYVTCSYCFACTTNDDVIYCNKKSSLM